MAKNDAKASVALVVGLLALLLGLFSAISVSQMRLQDSSPTERPTNLVEGLDEELEMQMVEVIEGFIAGDYEPPLEVGEGSGIAKGDDDAPVTIVEFSDYQCPFCKRFAEETLPGITEKYIDTGRVRLVFRDLPLGNHPRAIPAANAARCAMDQEGMDAYWQYHDLLFANQRALEDDDLRSYASEIEGLDLDEFATCLEENRFGEEIQADLMAAGQVGISGTPAFVINGKLVSGAQPLPVFEQVINEALEELGEEIPELDKDEEELVQE